MHGLMIMFSTTLTKIPNTAQATHPNPSTRHSCKQTLLNHTHLQLMADGLVSYQRHAIPPGSVVLEPEIDLGLDAAGDESSVVKRCCRVCLQNEGALEMGVHACMHGGAWMGAHEWGRMHASRESVAEGAWK